MVGVGFEYAFTNNWTAKIEYDYINLSHRTVTLDPAFVVNPLLTNPPIGPYTVSLAPNIQMVKVGFNYKFGW